MTAGSTPITAIDFGGKLLEGELWLINAVSALQAHFNCKMVAIEKIQLPKAQKNMKGRTLHDILHVSKKVKGENTSGHITRRANAPNSTFLMLYFAAVSLRIHVEFLNDERGKEKDR